MIHEYKTKAMNMKGMESLQEIRKCNINTIVMAYLNINSLRIKFDSLIEQITENIDILTILETKLDSSFHSGHFLVNGYSEPFRVDQNFQVICKGGYPIKTLGFEMSPTGGLYKDINLLKKKWLLCCCSYNPNKNNIQSNLEN